MPHRPATWEDLLPASKILAAGFADSALFGKYMHPKREQYPDDTYLSFLRPLRLDFYGGPDHRLIVSYSTSDNGTETVTGIAHFIRKRATPRSPGLYYSTMIRSTAAYNALESLVYPNRAADPTKLDVLDRMEPFTKHHWSGTRAESWYLSLIAVDPKAEKRGYGRELVKCGFDLAREEGIGCSVIAAPGRANFYRACGYDVHVGTTVDDGGEENPLRDVEVADVMFWDNGIEPQGIKKYGEK